MKFIKSVRRSLINIGRFFISRQFLFNILAAVVAIVIILWGGVEILKAYTNHSKSQVVPNCVGIHRDSAYKLLHNCNLRFKIIDSVYYSKYPKGAVIEQYPLPGAEVKENRRILLTVQSFGTEKVTIPTVLNVSVFQAIADIEARGLRIGKLRYIDYKYGNLVVNQKYQDKDSVSGIVVPKGSLIDLEVGKGKEDFTKVPDLLGNTYKEAIVKAARLYLNIGTITYDNSVKTYNDSITAKIWQQKPSSHIKNKVATASFIDIWLTQNDSKLKIGKITDETYGKADSTKTTDSTDVN